MAARLGVPEPEQQAAGQQRARRQAASTPSPAHGLIGRLRRPVVAWMARPAVIGPICSRCRRQRQRPGQVASLRGGRGVWFDDPDGHMIEITTRPLGERLP